MNKYGCLEIKINQCVIFPTHRMQVEVSKYTEGVNDKALRPNGLPKSLIRYDGNLSYLFISH